MITKTIKGPRSSWSVLSDYNSESMISNNQRKELVDLIYNCVEPEDRENWLSQINDLSEEEANSMMMELRF